MSFLFMCHLDVDPVFKSCLFAHLPGGDSSSVAFKFDDLLPSLSVATPAFMALAMCNILLTTPLSIFTIWYNASLPNSTML